MAEMLFREIEELKKRIRQVEEAYDNVNDVLSVVTNATKNQRSLLLIQDEDIRALREVCEELGGKDAVKRAFDRSHERYQAGARKEREDFLRSQAEGKTLKDFVPKK